MAVAELSAEAEFLEKRQLKFMKRNLRLRKNILNPR